MLTAHGDRVVGVSLVFGSFPPEVVGVSGSDRAREGVFIDRGSPPAPSLEHLSLIYWAGGLHGGHIA